MRKHETEKIEEEMKSERHCMKKMTKGVKTKMAVMYKKKKIQRRSNKRRARGKMRRRMYIQRTKSEQGRRVRKERNHCNRQNMCISTKNKRK